MKFSKYSSSLKSILSLKLLLIWFTYTSQAQEFKPRIEKLNHQIKTISELPDFYTNSLCSNLFHEDYLNNLRMLQSMLNKIIPNKELHPLFSDFSTVQAELQKIQMLVRSEIINNQNYEKSLNNSDLSKGNTLINMEESKPYSNRIILLLQSENENYVSKNIVELANYIELNNNQLRHKISKDLTLAVFTIKN